MSLELVNTFGTLLTVAIIAATAIAALVQLRHARGSNQIAALTELQDASHTPQYEAAEHFVRTELGSKLKDPEFRYQLCHRAVRTPEVRALNAKAQMIGNFYENMGLLVKSGLVDRDLALDTWSAQVAGDWNRLAPLAAIMRVESGDALWENFEYLVVLTQDWMAAHPSTYPRGVRRIALTNEWLEADKQYAASRAPA